ncbi:MAG TPA: 1-deoxy-D-xylulose-5-phosphate reductoisomerase [Micavibrio sp.]|nr:1-deoxy-D-xylulose-5-phosphate reductoisomerase [Micavibrio sp.]HIL29053.1 1-deoxy-D-xylulose-5-phosphate reductoisomerase [Micavibrio sp.]
MSDVRRISIFGATGSVGQATADVVLHNRKSFDVQVVTANSNVDALAELAVKLGAKYAVIGQEEHYKALQNVLLGTGIHVSAGAAALIEAATVPCDVVMAAIVGMAGLPPLMKSVEQGCCVAIANKEPLVAAGTHLMEAANASGAKILPVDSEHNAVFQVFDDQQKKTIERIILTASGGPFRERLEDELEDITPAQAVAHPNWSMGAKISVDSATLMNKALEVIEAHYLFDVPANQIDVVIHPQSLIHSMVEYCDGSILSQMGAPDMRTPIAYCLGWPSRMPTSGQKLSLNERISMEFYPADLQRFRALQMAYDCLDAGQERCGVFNAANEIAVQAFLEERIGFNDILRVNAYVLENCEKFSIKTLADVVNMDNTVRTFTSAYIDNIRQNSKKVYAS